MPLSTRSVRPDQQTASHSRPQIVDIADAQDAKKNRTQRAGTYRWPGLIPQFGLPHREISPAR